MTDVDVQPLRRPRSLERHPQLEVDTFCHECGYNLHGQPVTRDERLGIFICRCPECGRFYPAGTGTNATSPWRSRVATMMLVLWFLIVLSAAATICIGLGAIQMLHAETFSYWAMVSVPDGRPVEWGPLPGGAGAYGTMFKDTKQPAPNFKSIRTLQPQEEWEQQRDKDWKRLWLEIGLMMLGAAAMGLAAGVLLVTFLWHWPKRRYWLIVLLPFAISVLILAVMYADGEYADLFGWFSRRVLAYAAIEAALIMVGVLLGRPVARLLLRIFIPPAPRQHFAFLWHADGRAMPAARPA